MVKAEKIQKKSGSPAKKTVAHAAKRGSGTVETVKKPSAPLGAGKVAGMLKTAVPKKTVKPKTPAVTKRSAKTGRVKKTSPLPLKRFRCRICGYIYSPLRGEPHNGIPEGTAFDDLPDDYVCPVCGYQGKGRIGKWGFEEWHPTKYVCSVCGYIYDEKRGEPHRGITPGTKFEDLPDDYVCPVCALDPKITINFGKVLKQGFEPIDV